MDQATKAELECLRILLMAGLVDLRTGDLTTLAKEAANVFTRITNSLVVERSQSPEGVDR